MLPHAQESSTRLGRTVFVSSPPLALPMDAVICGVTAETYRLALARHPGGVAVVTVRSQSGPVGFTVTSFASASLLPPLVSFYVGHDSSSWPAVRLAPQFAVNLLGADQDELAARFARKGADRFAPPTKWDLGPEGLPLLTDATTHLICARHSSVGVGDHELVVGTVVNAAFGVSDQPLIYHQGRFARPEYHRGVAAPRRAEGM